MTDPARSSKRLPATLGEAFFEQAKRPTHDVAMQFIEPGGASLGESAITSLTFDELARKATSVALSVTGLAKAGDRALILCEPGPDYVAALLGCFYAGLIAVPAYPPMTSGVDQRVQRVAEDSRPSVVLTTALLAPQCEAINLRDLDHSARAEIVVVDELRQTDAKYTPQSAAPDSVALLQYTSGSTGEPRGVMLSHANILSNVTAIASHLNISGDDQAVFWLPPYHDMGLMGGILTPMLHGFGTTLMSPLSFLYDPLLWLEALTEYRTTISAAPSFAYDLCVRKAAAERVATFDLESLRVLINGAEPISYATMNRFTERFREVGFRRTAFMPCYGLAEATLMVTGTGPDEDLRIADPEPGAKDRAGRQGSPATEGAVSVGSTGRNGTVLIVDVETHRVCEEGETGEIWFQGPGVALGYWNNEKESQTVFGGRLVDGLGRDPFLRTGDLGTLCNGELYIAGRLKDLIIIRGRNYYPHDIEHTAIRADSRLRPGCIAAFEVEGASGPEVVVVAEPRATLTGDATEEIWQNIRRHISQEHGLAIAELVVIGRTTSLKTSSGKIRRRPTRAAYLDGSLTVMARHRKAHLAADAPVLPSHGGRRASTTRLTGASRGENDVATLELVRTHTASLLGDTVREAVDARLTFTQLGLDSEGAIELSSRLGEAMNIRLPATLAYDHPTPLAVAEYLRLRTEGGGQREMVRPSPSCAQEPIAIVGMSCRFPGDIWSPDDLWQFVASGGDAIGEFPSDRGWDLERLYNPDPDHPGTSYTRQGGFLKNAADFDADFFSISPLEAVMMDPQQRLLLEGAWEAVEHAGIDPASLKDSDTGVFTGVMTYDYGVGSDFEAHHGFGTANIGGAMVPGRIAYTLGLHGPAFSVDAACSTGLVAIHLACQALRQGECSLALAGAVTVLSHPGMFRLFSRQRRLAIDGRCKSFAAAADGAGFSEGMGVLALERLSDAQSNGHRVLAAVRGSATGHDGASNGLTAPNGPSQERVIRQALANAGVTASDVDAVEAQGSGTALGDSIEGYALLATYGQGRPHDRPLWLGSVKSNIGHSHAAGGMAGVIKMVQAMRYALLPATLHVDEPTPYVDWSMGEVRLLTEPQQWPTCDRPRRAGVSSFGATGTNAHLILEQPPNAEDLTREEKAPSVPRLPVVPLLVSGKSVEALCAQAARLRSHLQQVSEFDQFDVAFSLATTRAQFPYRAGVVGSDRELLLAGLEALQHGKQADYLLKGDATSEGKTAVLFSGEPSQWAGTDRQLREIFPIFAQTLDEVCGEVDRHLDHSVREWMSKQKPEATALPDRTELAQAAAFALEVALYRLIESLGIKPDYLVGHSIGELVAAYVAGVLSLEDAAMLAVARGRLLGASRDDDGMLADFAAITRDLHFSEPAFPIFSSQTGAQLTANETSAPIHWTNRMDVSARFSDLVGALERASVSRFLELGAAGELSTIVSRYLSDEIKRDALVAHALEPPRAATETLIGLVTDAYAHGVEIDWHELFAGRGAHPVELPTYAFQRSRYWPHDGEDLAAAFLDTTRALSATGNGDGE